MRPSMWTDALLDRKRLKMDDSADQAVEFLYQSYRDDQEGLENLNALLTKLVFEGQLDIPSLPAPVRSFAQKSGTLPAWLDEPLVKHGQSLFYINGFASTILLFCASLPECYVMSKGVHVLGETGYLIKRPKIRIIETSQMVRDVMSPGQLAPDGRGVLAAQKVRLLHAAVRYLILHASDVHDEADEGAAKRYASRQWDTTKLGLPICQEDLAYTLQTFAYVIARGLDRLGVRLTADEREAYLHCWNVTGHVLGIDRDLIPEPEPGDPHSRWELARALYEKIRKRQAGRTEPGVKLAAALVCCMEDIIGEEVEKTRLLKHLGARKLRYVPPFIMQHVLKDGTTTLLDVRAPRANAFEQALLKLTLWLWKDAEKGYQSMVTGPLARISVGLHQVLTDYLTRLPPTHVQEFLPDRLKRIVHETGRAPSEILAAEAKARADERAARRQARPSAGPSRKPEPPGPSPNPNE